jgi:hypothetical protein
MNIEPQNQPDQTAVENTGAISATTNRRRRGHVARLPKNLREKINSMLDDGMTYVDIAAEVQKSKPFPPLAINEDHIRSWKEGGYQDWLKERQQVEAMRTMFERTMDLVGNTEAEELPDLTTKLLAARICGLLAKITPQELCDNATSEPQNLPRLLNLVPKLSREALRTRIYRRNLDKEKAAQPASKEAQATSRAQLLDKMDQLLGIRPVAAVDRIFGPAGVDDRTASSSSQIPNLQPEIASS